jgi:hypothetical protein
MSFLQQIIQTTKESNKKYKMERAEYERASNVLYDIAERKIKKCVTQRAKDGYTDATFDVIDDLKLDIAGKWSIPELLFAIIFEDAPPVVSRLFYLSNSPFDGFAISTKAKGAGPPSVFVLDWAYEMLKPLPQPAPPIKPQPAPKPAPKPAPPANIEAVYYPLPPVSNWDMGMFNTEESILGTPPTKPRVQTPPGAPVKPINPVVRNLFADSSLPPVTEQQILDYLTTFYGVNPYPK